MQGFSDPQRELLDADSVTGHLLPAGSVFGFLAQHRLALFPAEMFTDLFRSGRGPAQCGPGCGRVGVGAAGVAWFVGSAGRRRGDVRSAVEGGVRARGHRHLFPCDHVDLLAAATGGIEVAGPDLRRCPDGDQADRGDQGKDPAGAGLHRARRRGATQDTVTQLVQAPRRSWWDGRPRVTTPGRVKPDIAWDDKAAKAGYGSSRRHPDDCCGWFVRLCAHPNGTERGFGDLRVRRSTAALRRRSPSG